MARNLGFKEAAFVIGTSFLGGDVGIYEQPALTRTVNKNVAAPTVARNTALSPRLVESLEPTQTSEPKKFLELKEATRLRFGSLLDSMSEEAAQLQDHAELIRAQARGEVIEILADHGCVTVRGGALGYSNCPTETTSSQQNPHLPLSGPNSPWAWDFPLPNTPPALTKKVFRGNWHHRGGLTVSPILRTRVAKALTKKTAESQPQHDFTLMMNQQALWDLHLNSRVSLLQNIMHPFNSQEELEISLRSAGSTDCKEKVDGINTLLSGVSRENDSLGGTLSWKLDTLGFEEYDLGPLGNGWMLDDELCDQSY